jgi:hypothetical protein
MKKLVLTLTLFGATYIGFAQNVIFEVLTPAPVEGLYPVEYAPQGAEGWSAIPDLMNPDNSITGQLVFVSDGTEGDTLGCNPLTNGADVSGKIAVIWRGVCPFATKAFNAWEAGAIGVVLVNNAVGSAPIVPGAAAGGAGEAVNVPVAMTDRTTGELLREHILSGTATAFLGSVPNFANNLVIEPGNVFRALGAVFPAPIVQNASEFSVPMGAGVTNTGTAEQTGVSVTATITLNGTVIYNETSDPASIAPGDTAFFVLPTFSQASYEQGYYQVALSTTGNEAEEFPADNTLDASFAITPDVYALTTWNPATQDVVNAQWFTPATFDLLMEVCVHFQSPYADRLALQGLTFAAWNFDQPLTGEIIDVTAYEWNNEFTTLTEFFDSEADLMIEPWDFGVHQYDANLIQENIFVPFENQLQLENNQRYLFCVTTSNPAVRIGHAPSTVLYERANLVSDQPLTTVANATNIFLAGWASGDQAGFGIKFEDLTVGLEETSKEEITPYPNPTHQFVNLPYAGSAATANLMIYNVDGKLAASERINFNGNNFFQVDVANLPSGTYVFNLQFDNNTTSAFKVVVSH